MEIHNVIEELVFAEVERACIDINKEVNKKGTCTCPQCRMDVACYVLNRLQPHYIISSRGILREENFNVRNQQKIADITALVYNAFEQVSLNRRPGFDHMNNGKEDSGTAKAYFNIPVIIGRIFNGKTFEPIYNIDVELRLNGGFVKMKDANWQNPCKLIKKTEGTFTFWPESLPSTKVGEKKILNFSIKASIPGFLTLVHHFELPVVSEKERIHTVGMNRTHKITDLYMFDNDDDEVNG
ncbi:MAG: late competence development ComFB family protein [Spirochaetaceae bacterium]|nr:late competence development ComFB family protein [Spirochaetaceae bacterium]